LTLPPTPLIPSTNTLILQLVPAAAANRRAQSCFLRQGFKINLLELPRI
jgi:hypothetical protein